MRLIIVTILGVLCHTMMMAQPLCHVVQYNEEDGVPSSHVVQLLQDEYGFMWFATWNGLCRYDGYEFKTFKTQVGDGCHMTTDRIRNITLLPQGDILCRVDDGFFLFDKKTYRFRDLTEKEREQTTELEHQNRQSKSLQRKPFVWTDPYLTHWTLDGNGRLTYQDAATGRQVDYPLSIDFRTLTFAMTDAQGNLWALDYGSIYKFTTDKRRSQRLPIEPQAEVKCLFSDSQGRYWVATKDDEALRIYRSSDNQLLGYLGADGNIHKGYTRFGAAVYCMYETKDGTLWLGTKPQGLYRLCPTTTETFKMAHFMENSHREIYHLTEDRQGRLWVATLDGGILCINNPQADNPLFTVPRHYPKEAGQRARYLLITADDILLTATSNGLLVSQLKPQTDDMHFRLHQRETDRKESLSCNATMDVVQDMQGHIFVGTESGGINEIVNSNLQDSVLSFHHIKEQFHVQPNDIVLSQKALKEGGLMAVGSHLITMLDSTHQGRVLDVCRFDADYRFSEAHPLLLKDGRWLFGLINGAFTTTTEQMYRQSYCPQMVLTGISIQGASDDWSIAHADTIVLSPEERSFTLHFAAIDYVATKQISYAFRLQTNGMDDTTQWNYIGHDRSATLLDLEPGTYLLEIRSTNADGEWQDNTRRLTIIVEPTFWESAWGRLLILLLIVGTLSAITFTLLYIRRIKRQQRETLEKYLALIKTKEQKEEATAHTTSDKPVASNLDPMLERVMKYVEDNISNSDANIGDMALAAATSRSGLQRKLKQAMGITPQDLMKEARIKHACLLLKTSDKNISEVAYACGFTDPKYFSRNFKQSTGMSPSEYRESE